MELLIVQLLNAIIQVLLFSFIPFIWWVFSGRKKEGFFSWVGLKLILNNGRKKVLLFSSITLFVFIVLSVYILFLLKDVPLATSEFDGLGITALPAAIVYSFIKTGLSEEKANGSILPSWIIHGLSNLFSSIMAMVSII